MADADRQGSEVVRTVGQLVGLFAAVIALVYAAGGGVLVLRLFVAGLPSRTVVGQLPRDLLISVGLAQIVLPALAVAAMYAAVRLLLGTTPPPTRFVRQWKERSRRGWSELILASALPALAATVIAAFRVDRDRWILAFAFLLTQLLVLVAVNLRARLAVRYASASLWNTWRPVISMTLVVALASLPGCVIFAGTINLLDAEVCPTSGPPVKGLLIGETSDRIYVGERKARGPRLVFSIPLSQVKETFIGGNAGSKPCP